MLILNTTKHDTEFLCKLCSSCADLVELKSRNFVVIFKESKNPCATCHRCEKVWLGDLPRKFRTHQEVFNEAVRQKKFGYTAFGVSVERENCNSVGATRDFLEYLRVDGGFVTIYMPKGFDGTVTHVGDLIPKDQFVFETIVHEIQHVADTQHGLYFTGNDPKYAGRRPKWIDREEEKRARKRQLECRQLLVEQQLPVVTQLLEKFQDEK